MAFGASLQSNFSEHESFDDSENEGSEDVLSFNELKESYDMWYRESVKINETNLKLAEKYNNSHMELAIVKNKVEELQGALNSVTSEKEKLSNEDWTAELQMSDMVKLSFI
ncbi:hypothetical protein RHGRI_017242 [Rhododendron griersonianum]|uniref:Uncharacterized protein n=1 Tax=Rhododendron griersonianum TaxID=479676 RepID=A0AAV6JX23_9ERIC|nr:hypothetical protein RHGRI_017242 [Rhododendron griersonianum]